MADMADMVDVSSLESLPVTVTIPMKNTMEAAETAVRAGNRPWRPVVAASTGSMLYVIDGLETLEGHRAAGDSQIPCSIVEAQDAAEATRLHLAFSSRLPVNPFLVMDAIEWIRESGGSVSGIEPRYIRLAELPLSPSVRDTFCGWMDRLSHRLDTMPEFWHIFKPLSEIQPSEQARALDSVMSFVNATGISPDASSLRGILRQFAPTQSGAPQVAPVETTYRQKPEARNDADDAKPLDNSSRVSCECGKQWYVDAKSARKVRDMDNMTVLTDEDGEPVYPVPGEVARHLDMGNSPAHYYTIPGPFPAVLLSCRPLERESLDMVAGALKAA